MIYRKFLHMLPYIICILFFIAYSILSIVRHNNYQSFGYDLGINDQTVWRYAHFQPPLSTIAPIPDKTKLAEHVELVYAFISPAYWIWETRKMLLLLEVAAICLSGLAVYFLARKKGLKEPVALALVIGYLGFYGVQGAMWFDVHSATFGTAFMMWFIYFLETKKKIPALIFFFLAITSKENIGLYTFLISLVYFFKYRTKLSIFFMAFSLAYVSFIFFVFFPHIEHVNYLYANKDGILSNLNPLSLIDTDEKRQVIWYSLLSFGFLALLAPLYLIPALGHLALFFVVASDLNGAQGLYMHYRVSMAPLLIYPTIIAIARYKKKLNKWQIGAYLLVCTMVVQYVLHLPLSYLSKGWFWTQSPAVKNINDMRDKYLPKDASVVAQNNIVPHISHRDKIYSLYPEKKQFKKDSPCGKKECDWFRWYSHPEFLLVDTSSDWDARHLLINNAQFIQGLTNLEKAGIIKRYKQIGNTKLYKIIKNP
jgi:uncharacterized membrane protein